MCACSFLASSPPPLARLISRGERRDTRGCVVKVHDPEVLPQKIARGLRPRNIRHKERSVARNTEMHQHTVGSPKELKLSSVFTHCPIGGPPSGERGARTPMGRHQVSLRQLVNVPELRIISFPPASTIRRPLSASSQARRQQSRSNSAARLMHCNSAAAFIQCNSAAASAQCNSAASSRHQSAQLPEK